MRAAKPDDEARERDDCRTAEAPQATVGKVSGLILIMRQLLELQR